MLVKAVHAEILAPKYSNEVVVVCRNSERVHFNKLSQRIVRGSVNKVARALLSKLDKLWKLSLKPMFHRWRTAVYRKSKGRNFGRSIPPFDTTTVSQLSLYRTGLHTIFCHKYHICKAALGDHFVRWRRQTQYDHALKIRIFDKWSIKTSQLRLSRLTARRFIVLMRPLIRVVERQARRLYLRKWSSWLAWYYDQVVLSDALRYWRARVRSAILCRRRQKRNAIKTLLANARTWNALLQRLTHQCAARVAMRALRRHWALWQSALRRKRILSQVFARFCRDLCLRAWLIWRRLAVSAAPTLSITIDTTHSAGSALSPPKSSAHEPTITPKRLIVPMSQLNKRAVGSGATIHNVSSSYRRASFQGGGADSLVYKRVTKVAKRRAKSPGGTGAAPPSTAAGKRATHSAPPTRPAAAAAAAGPNSGLSVPASTLLDRIAYRLAAARELSARYEREQQERRAQGGMSSGDDNGETAASTSRASMGQQQQQQHRQKSGGASRVTSTGLKAGRRV